LSIVTIMKVPRDTAKYGEFFAAGKEKVAAISARAENAGCASHVFTQGDGVTAAVDHWGSQAAFERFLADPRSARPWRAPGIGAARDRELRGH
jgi:hypothetical protein